MLQWFIILLIFDCRCSEGFYGVRCQTRGSDVDTSVPPPAPSSKVSTVTAVVVVLVILVVLIAAAVAAVTIMRKRRRGKPFMHVRMQSQENVEISNPMYLREDADEDVEPMEPSFVLASNKVDVSCCGHLDVIDFSLWFPGHQLCKSCLRVHVQRHGGKQYGQWREKRSFTKRNIISSPRATQGSSFSGSLWILHVNL